MAEVTIYCSFCGKAHHDATKMIVGPVHVAICDECVEHCVDILLERSRPRRMLWGDIGIPPERAVEFL